MTEPIADRIAGRPNPNLSHLFSAHRVALIGASLNNIYSMGLINRVRNGTQTHLIGVHPRHTEVSGIRCVPSVRAIGEVVDAAFVAVPAPQVLPTLKECVSVGIRAAVVVSAGFGDSPLEAARQRETDLQRFALETGMAICGPSCLGIANITNQTYLFGSTAAGVIPNGTIGLISQSGGTVSALVRSAVRRRLGFSALISSGVEACLDTCDYFEYLIEDEATSVICLFLERLSDPERFIKLVRRSHEARKAILCIKIGRSSQGARAALGHTGSLTGSDTFYETLFEDLGVVRSSSVEEMMDRASLMAQSHVRHWPSGGRIGVVTVSGGAGTILADLCSQNDLFLPPLSDQETIKMQSELPERVKVGNPMDVSAQLQREVPESWTGAIGALARSRKFDAVLVADLHPQDVDRIRFLARLRSETGTPLALTPVADGFDILTDSADEEAYETQIPVLSGGEPAVRALAGAAAVAKGRERALLRGESWWDGTDPWNTAAYVHGRISDQQSAEFNEVTLRELLVGTRVRAPRERWFISDEEAKRYLPDFNFPIAVKISDQRFIHKAAVDLLFLNIEDVSEARTSIDILWSHATSLLGGSKPQGVLIQEMINGSHYELYVSTLCDNGVRPVISVGRGGASVEAHPDIRRTLAPVSPIAAEQLLLSLRSAPRAAEVDIEAASIAISLIASVAVGMRDRIRTLEFNPIMIKGPGQGAFIVDSVFEARASENG